MTQQETDADSIGTFLNELDIRIRARYPLIAINTYEEDRVKDALLDLVFQERHKEKPFFSGAVLVDCEGSSIQRRAASDHDAGS
ncbi:MAG: hypothetical protein IPI28_19340 [Candidatus Omnitrophica bacterium]|nr:hypothetical protein [Candidatus Omnitrophota bacterium]